MVFAIRADRNGTAVCDKRRFSHWVPEGWRHVSNTGTHLRGATEMAKKTAAAKKPAPAKKPAAKSAKAKTAAKKAPKSPKAKAGK